jgi:chromosome partitioning protein
MEPKMLAGDLTNLLGVTPQAIHNQLKRKQLPFIKSRNRVYFSHSTTKQILNLSFKPQTITFQIIKGGTGKTTICHSIAVRAALYGVRVLCIDLDQQGNLTTAFRVDPDKQPVMFELLTDSRPITDGIVQVCDGIDLLPSRIENALLDNFLMLKRFALDRVYKDLIQPLKQKYDLILIDCPPALGTSVTSAALASDLVICPVTPGRFDLSGLNLSISEMAAIEKNYDRKIPIKILLNGFDSRKSLSHEILKFLVKHESYGDKLFKTTVRTSQEFTNVIMEGTSIFDSLKHGIAKEDIDLLTREILGLEQMIRQQNEPARLEHREEERFSQLNA